MIFKRTLQSELIFYSGAVYAALTLITLTFTLIRLLGQATDGRIDPQTVFVLLGYALVNYQAIVLSLSVFLGTLLVFSRMWRDSEMVIWQTAGLSLRSFVWPTLRFAIPLAMLAGLFSLLIAPWANQQAFEFKDRFERRDDLSRVATQQFKENRDGSRLFYVGSVDEQTQAASNLLIVERLPNRPGIESVVAAKTGRIVSDETGDRFLELNQGRRYQLPSPKLAVAAVAAPASASTVAAAGTQKPMDIGLMAFEQYRVLMAEKSAAQSSFVPYRQRSTPALLSDNTPTARGELIWRLGTPLMCVLLAMLAVPLSYFNPRSGKSAPLILAILLFVIYMNAVSLAQNYVQSGKLPPLLALLAPHTAILVLALALLLWRSQGLMPLLGAVRRQVASRRSNRV